LEYTAETAVKQYNKIKDHIQGKHHAYHDLDYTDRDHLGDLSADILVRGRGSTGVG